MTQEQIKDEMARIVAEFGEWTYDLPLPYEIWTAGNQQLPHTRLKRHMQIIHDMAAKPFDACRILDLGCLEGMFSLECAWQGADVVGIDAREANIRKAIFAKEATRTNGVSFVRDDARNVSAESYGLFDVVICSGLLYHLDTPDNFQLVEEMYRMATDLVIIDTHISLIPTVTERFKAKAYRGARWREHPESDSETAKEGRLLSSFGNDSSFILTRPSLINLLSHVGFSSTFECFNPPHLNYGRPGLEHRDRCTFVAKKGTNVRLIASPAANDLLEEWPENSLTYAGSTRRRTRQWLTEVVSALKNLR